MWVGSLRNADFLGYCMDSLQGIIETKISVKIELISLILLSYYEPFI